MLLNIKSENAFHSLVDFDYETTGTGANQALTEFKIVPQSGDDFEILLTAREAQCLLDSLVKFLSPDEMVVIPRSEWDEIKGEIVQSSARLSELMDSVK